MNPNYWLWLNALYLAVRLLTNHGEITSVEVHQDIAEQKINP